MLIATHSEEMKLLTKYGPENIPDWRHRRDEIVPVEITPAAKWFLSENARDSINPKNEFPVAAPPWKLSAYEYSAPSGFYTSNNGQTPRFLVIADGWDRDDFKEAAGVLPPKGLHWFSSYFVLGEWGRTDVRVGYVRAGMDESGTLEMWDVDADPEFVRVFGGSERQAEGSINGIMAPVLFGVSLLHCKNVSLVDDPVPTKVRENRKAKDQEPGVTFKQLKIDPMKQQVEHEAGDTGESEMERALHICRGHFKDYRGGNGLFGEHKGVYWWDMHARGTEEAGKVEKEYNVESP